jgi:hypothetical protein
MRLLKKVKRKNRIDDHWAEIRDKVDMGLELRRPFERQWIVNIAFLTGNQYVFWNSSAHRLQHLRGTNGRIHSVDNIILPKWLRLVSDLIKMRPEIGVIPNSTTEEDILAAKLGKKAAEWYFRTKLTKAKIRQIAVWMYTTGNCFLDDRWNPKSGPMAMDKTNGKIVYAGDVDGDVWSPFDMLFPIGPGVTDHQDMPWIMKRQRKNIEWIRENFKRGDEVEPEDIASSAISLENLMSKFAGATDIDRIESAYVINLYVKPCKDYPRGAYFVASNGIVEEKREFPYAEFSLEHFKDLELPGVFYGDCRVSHSISLQRSWNNDVSSVEEFNKDVARAKLGVPKGSNIEVTPTNEHGEIIEYTPVLGHKPDFLSMPTTSPSLDRNQNRIMLSMENLFSQHEVSRGTNKSDIRSGDMVELLLEQDAHGGLMPHAIFEEALENHMRRILIRMQEGYRGPRLLKLGETMDDFEVISFQGADLKNNTDVKIVKQSSLPESEATQTMRVERRYEQGLYGDPMDPRTKRRVLRMIDANVVDDIFSGEKQDEENAQMENRVLVQGKPVLPNPYDNHGIHLAEHERFLKGQKIQRLKLQNPEAYQRLELIFYQHMQVHQNILSETLKKQMAMQNGGNENGGAAK